MEFLQTWAIEKPPANAEGVGRKPVVAAPQSIIMMVVVEAIGLCSIANPFAWVKS